MQRQGKHREFHFNLSVATLTIFILINTASDLKKHLCEPELRLMYPCSKLLLAAGAGSNEACCIVMKHVIPLLQEQFVKHQQVSYPVTNLHIVDLGT